MILNEQQTMIRDMARQFARDRLTPNAARWDREAHFPMEEIREMGRLGLMGMAVPVEWGEPAPTPCRRLWRSRKSPLAMPRPLPS